MIHFSVIFLETNPQLPRLKTLYTQSCENNKTSSSVINSEVYFIHAVEHSTAIKL